MEFHELANQYPLMPVLELNQLEEDMRLRGYDKRFPIITFQGAILDGRNRFIASERAEVGPVYTEFVGSEQDAELFVHRANEHRRHLTAEWLAGKKLERIKRVAEQRQQGKSIRTIAEAEKVSPATVHRDIESAGVHPETPENKVVGKDGKPQASKKAQVLCRHCEHRVNVGRPIIDNCVDCAELRRILKPKRSSHQKEEPASQEPEKLVDDAGVVVPQRLIPVFESVKDYKRAEALLTSCSKAFKVIETGPTKDAKSLNANEHYRKFFSTFKAARARLVAMCPSLVCPDCGGDACEKCFDGWLSKERVDAKQ